MNTTLASLCSIVQHSFDDGYLITFYIIQTVICLALVPPAIVLCVAVGKATVLHKNVRICLINLIVSTVVSNVGTAIIAGYHLLAIYSPDDNLCFRLIPKVIDCRIIQSVRNIGALMTVSGLLFLAAERVCATVQFKTYEKNGSLVIGIGLTVIQVCLSEFFIALYTLHS